MNEWLTYAAMNEWLTGGFKSPAIISDFAEIYFRISLTITLFYV